MESPTELDALQQEILLLLRHYEIPAEGVSLTVTLAPADFDRISRNHPDLVHPEIIRREGEIAGVLCYIQILRQLTFPPDLVLSAPTISDGR